MSIASTSFGGVQNHHNHSQQQGVVVAASQAPSYRIRDRARAVTQAVSNGSSPSATTVYHQPHHTIVYATSSNANVSSASFSHRGSHLSGHRGSTSASVATSDDGSSVIGGYDCGTDDYEAMGSGSNTGCVGNGEATCAVCGDGHAKLHYGVLACYGCKGFFRRTLTGKYRYVCRFGSNCVVDKYQRNSCRFCRFNRCLEVGMDPKAVRPDRDLTGKQRVPRARKRQIDEELINHIMRLQGDDWSRKIPVEAKVLLMQLLNVESKVAKGDTVSVNSSAVHSSADQKKSVDVSPLSTTSAIGSSSTGDIISSPSPSHQQRNVSLRELFERKPSLNGRRTEMCYEPYRMARPEELPQIAHRSAIAAVDWVDALAEIGDFTGTEDKVALVKCGYAPLTIFNFSARTAQNTKDVDILCLCSYSFVPRKLPPQFNATNHLSSVLIDRTLNELVAPLRRLNLREEEVVPLKAIIILNPNAKGLSPEAQQLVAELRDRVQDMLFQVVKELHPAYNASSRFGNLLLLLPTITTLSGVMCENIQFTQAFGNRAATEPLLNELFEESSLSAISAGDDVLLAGGGYDEPLITSTSHNLTPPPLFHENPAGISLQSYHTNSSGDNTDYSTASSRSSTSYHKIQRYSPQQPSEQQQHLAVDCWTQTGSGIPTVCNSSNCNYSSASSNDSTPLLGTSPLPSGGGNACSNSGGGASNNGSFLPSPPSSVVSGNQYSVNNSGGGSGGGGCPADFQTLNRMNNNDVMESSSNGASLSTKHDQHSSSRRNHHRQNHHHLDHIRSAFEDDDNNCHNHFIDDVDIDSLAGLDDCCGSGDETSSLAGFVAATFHSTLLEECGRRGDGTRRMTGGRGEVDEEEEEDDDLADSASTIAPAFSPATAQLFESGAADLFELMQ